MGICLAKCCAELKQEAEKFEARAKKAAAHAERLEVEAWDPRSISPEVAAAKAKEAGAHAERFEARARDLREQAAEIGPLAVGEPRNRIGLQLVRGILRSAYWAVQAMN